MAAFSPSFMGGYAANPVSRLELYFTCHHLKNLDIGSKSDPQVWVYLEDADRSGRFALIGKTEIIYNNLDPKFTKTIKIDYYFEQVQHLKVVVYDVDKPEGAAESQDLIGDAHVTLADIVSSKGQTVTKSLQTSQRTNRGTITIYAEEIKDMKLATTMRFSARHLDKKDLFGKSDPFFRISRKKADGSVITVYKSEVIKKTLDPTWKEFEVPIQKLNNGDFDAPLLIEVFDWNASGKDDFIGACTLSLRALETAQKGGKDTPLINEEHRASRRKAYVNSGQLLINRCDITEKASFIDYLRGGLQLNLVCSIDYTGSNGDPKSANSLHHRGGEPNEYMRAIRAAGEVLLSYDVDGRVPVFGFGAQLPKGGVSHLFAVNFNEDNPDVQGVEGILEAYHKSLDKVKLMGPTNFAPSIRKACSLFNESNKSGAQCYTILLILTDGEITDFQDTIDEIVKASDLGISIVIVGVGRADFQQMDSLDADEKPLASRRGEESKRDIVQFVPFRKFSQSAPQLSAALLAEIPDQVTSYFKAKGIKPLIPLMPSMMMGPSMMGPPMGGQSMMPPYMAGPSMMGPPGYPGGAYSPGGYPPGAPSPGGIYPYGAPPGAPGGAPPPGGAYPPSGAYPPGGAPPPGGAYPPGAPGGAPPGGPGGAYPPGAPGGTPPPGGPGGAYPPGAPPSGAPPPGGAYPPGAPPPGGAYPPGAPGGAPPPGGPGGAYPPGAPGGAPPPGSASPGHAPGGTPPPGGYPPSGAYPPGGAYPSAYPPGPYPGAYPPGGPYYPPPGSYYPPPGSYYPPPGGYYPPPYQQGYPNSNPYPPYGGPQGAPSGAALPFGGPQGAPQGSAPGGGH